MAWPEFELEGLEVVVFGVSGWVVEELEVRWLEV